MNTPTQLCNDRYPTALVILTGIVAAAVAGSIALEPTKLIFLILFPLAVVSSPLSLIPLVGVVAVSLNYRATLRSTSFSPSARRLASVSFGVSLLALCAGWAVVMVGFVP